jgi:hypothetical protein
MLRFGLSLAVSPLLVVACAGVVPAPSGPRPQPEPALLTPAPISSQPSQPSAPPPPVVAIEPAPAPVEPAPEPAATDVFDWGEPLGPTHVTAKGTAPAGFVTDLTFGRYRNPRFAFALDVPIALERDPPPENGDGQVFRFRDEFELVAYGMLDQGREASGAPPVNRDAGHRAYKGVTSSTRVWNDTEGHHWEKILFADGIFVHVTARATRSSAAFFAPIVLRAERSLRVTVGGSYARPERVSQPY